MSQAYSMDLRTRVLADVDDGMKPAEVAQKYRVSRSWVYKILHFRRTTGSCAARQPRRSRTTKLDDVLPAIEAAVRQKPDATLRELREMLNLSVGLSTLWRALKRLQFTFKKSTACQ